MEELYHNRNPVEQNGFRRVLALAQYFYLFDIKINLRTFVPILRGNCIMLENNKQFIL
jgi:hypothetical protein